MDIYNIPLISLSQLSVIDHWHAVQTLIKRAASKKPHDWQLPLIACEAVGGNIQKAFPAVTAIACAQISIILIDDLLDDDPRGEYHHIGMPAAANLAATFQALGLEALMQPDASQNPATQLNTTQSINTMLYTTAYGQYLDTLNPATEPDYWRMVQTKSAPFFGAALHIGALLGGASPQIAEHIKQFGWLYGEIIQIHDDLNDTMVQPANPDWLLGRLPLPILYAQAVDHPDRERFIELRQNISEPGALTEAQEILVRCGALSYGIHQLLVRHQQAQTILNALPNLHTDGLQKLLNNLLEPVWALFTEAGANTTTLRTQFENVPA